MQIYRKQGKKDIFFALAEVVLHLLNHLKQNQVQIDVCIYGIGIFDYQTYPCRIYKVNKSCTESNCVI